MDREIPIRPRASGGDRHHAPHGAGRSPPVDAGARLRHPRNDLTAPGGPPPAGGPGARPRRPARRGRTGSRRPPPGSRAPPGRRGGAPSYQPRGMPHQTTRKASSFTRKSSAIAVGTTGTSRRARVRQTRPRRGEQRQGDREHQHERGEDVVDRAVDRPQVVQVGLPLGVRRDQRVGRLEAQPPLAPAHLLAGPEGEHQREQDEARSDRPRPAAGRAPRPGTGPTRPPGPGRRRSRPTPPR